MLLMLDGNGHEIFQKADLPDKPRVCVSKANTCFCRENYQVWNMAYCCMIGRHRVADSLDGSIISGSLHPREFMRFSA